jgi:hypothetical protein
LKQSICPLHDEQLLLELLALHGADCFRLGVASDFFSGYTETWPVLTSPGLLFEFARQTAQVSKGDVPGTVVSFQFEAMAFSGAKKQLDLIMHAFEAHILFDPTAKGVWLRLEAKHPQPSKVFTSFKSWKGSHSKVFIYPGLLLSCADTPDTQGFSVTLSKKDLG